MDNIDLHIEEQFSKNEEKNIRLKEILNQFKGEKIIIFKREYGTEEMSKTYMNLGFNCAYFDSDKRQSIRKFHKWKCENNICY